MLSSFNLIKCSSLLNHVVPCTSYAFSQFGIVLFAVYLIWISFSSLVNLPRVHIKTKWVFVVWYYLPFEVFFGLGVWLYWGMFVLSLWCRVTSYLRCLGLSIWFYKFRGISFQYTNFQQKTLWSVLHPPLLLRQLHFQHQITFWVGMMFHIQANFLHCLNLYR